MCGRFSLSTSTEVVILRFLLDGGVRLAPRYNIAPSQPVAVVRAPRGRRELALVHWGLVPAWAKDPAIGARMINARAETVAEKPSFRNALRRRRCLVLSNGFYEWRRTGGARQPHLFRLRDGGPFGMAGIWEHWIGADGSELETCAILTTASNDLMRPVHHRMPIIVAPEHHARWLDPHLDRAADVADLLGPYPAGEMIAFPVRSFVNNARNEGAHCVEPLPDA